METMVHAPGAPASGDGAHRAPGAEFAITLKGWRSQLRWAMTKGAEDPARVWLEVISIDERSKRALEEASSQQQAEDLRRFRGKLEESIATLTQDLGDEKLGPLYSWLDLVRQRRRLGVKIEEACAAVTQARALRTSAGSGPPKKERDAVEQLARAQGELAQWKTATPPPPPAGVLAAWDAQGGEALVERMPREAMAVGRRGDEARRILENVKGRSPGKHPWPRSRGEHIAIPLVGGAALLCGLFAAVRDSGVLGWLAGLSSGALVALVAWSFFARKQEQAELVASVDWVWHARMYQERTRVAELEAGWLRALVDSHRALRSFDARAGTGGQLRDFEAERPDLAPIIDELARDTEPLRS
jgi:hypothetical protein